MKKVHSRRSRRVLSVALAAVLTLSQSGVISSSANTMTDGAVQELYPIVHYERDGIKNPITENMEIPENARLSLSYEFDIEKDLLDGMSVELPEYLLPDYENAEPIDVFVRQAEDFDGIYVNAGQIGFGADDVGVISADLSAFGGAGESGGGLEPKDGADGDGSDGDSGEDSGSDGGEDSADSGDDENGEENGDSGNGEDSDGDTETSGGSDGTDGSTDGDSTGTGDGSEDSDSGDESTGGSEGGSDASAGFGSESASGDSSGGSDGNASGDSDGGSSGAGGNDSAGTGSSGGDSSDSGSGSGDSGGSASGDSGGGGSSGGDSSGGDSSGGSGDSSGGGSGDTGGGETAFGGLLAAAFGATTVYADDLENESVLLSVKIEIPAVFDLDKIDPADETGLRTVTIKSGNSDVTVILAEALEGDEAGAIDVASFMMRFSNHAIESDPLKDVVKDFEITEFSYYDYPFTDVQSGDTIEWDTELYLGYAFKLPNDGTFAAIKAKVAADGSVSYYVPVPQYLTCPTGMRTELDTEAGGKFGELWTDDDGKLIITFCGELWENDGINSLNVVLDAECMLDEDEIGTDTTANIDFNGDIPKVTINVGGNAPAEHKFTKEGKFNTETNHFEWTIKFIPGGTPTLTAPLTLTDTFATNEQVYVAGSMTVTGITPDPVVTPSVGDPNTTITYTFADVPTVPTFIKYETALADYALDASNTGNVTSDLVTTNNAKITDSATENPFELTDSDTVTVPKESKMWVVKDFVIDIANRTIDWKIVINTNDRRLRNLVMHDEFDSTMLELVDGSVEIGGTAATVDESTSDCSFELTIPEKGGGGYEQRYEITYTTKIKDSVFDDPAADPTTNMDNKAWLSFDWHPYGDGTGEWKPYTMPDITKSPAAPNTAIISKSGTYNPATHVITWTITVNPHKVDISEGLITDGGLISKKQKYVDGSFERLNVGKPYYNFAANGEDGISFNVGEDGGPPLRTATVDYLFETLVTAPLDYAYNNEDGAEPIYENLANFDGKVGSYDVNHDAEGEVAIVSKVIEKTGFSFDYTNKQITWRVEVNQNKMPMPDAEIVDVLANGLTYYPNSAKIISIDGMDQTINLTASGGTVGNPTLTIPLDGNCDEQTAVVEFITNVTDETIKLFKEGNNTKLFNTAKLTRTGFPANVESTGEIDVGNKLLDKTGVLDGAKINYTVNINPNELDLTGVTLVDQMSKNGGIRLLKSTVELYKVSVDANGKFPNVSAGTLVDSSDYNLTYDPIENKFEMEFPNNAPDTNKQSYILKYSCIITDNMLGPFSNSVSLTGGDIDSGSTSDSGNVKAGKLGGKGTTNLDTTRLIIKKVDSERPGVGLNGVEFELYETQTGTLVDAGVTATGDTSYYDSGGNETSSYKGEKGVLSFYPLELNTSYTLVETKNLDGYSNPLGKYKDDAALGTIKVGTFVLGDAATFVTTGTDSGKLIEVVITNDPEDAEGNEVEFIKRYDVGPFNFDDISFELQDQTPGAETNIIIGKLQPGSGDSRTYTFTPETGKSLGLGTYLLVETMDAGTNTEKYYVNKKYWLEIYADGKYEFFKDDGGKKGEPITDQGATETNILNETKKASVTINKFDDETGFALDGAKFKIEYVGDSGYGRPTILSSDATKTVTNGKVTFENLVLYEEYMITEEENPTGYVNDTTNNYVTVIFDTDGVASFDFQYSDGKASAGSGNSINWDNTPEVFDFSFTKANEHGLKIEGVTFTLKKPSTDLKGDDGSKITRTAPATGTDGVVNFTNISPGAYWLTESAPADHIQESYVLIVDTSGGYKIYKDSDVTINATTGSYVINNDSPLVTNNDTPLLNEPKTASVTVNKLDDETELAFDGAVFKLDYANAAGSNRPVLPSGYTSGVAVENGKVTFENLVTYETYIITEVSNPEGYVDPNGTAKSITVSFNDSGAVSITDNSSDGKASAGSGNSINWDNTPKKYPVEFNKKDDLERNVQGAVFTISKPAKNGTITHTATSDASGVVLFDGINSVSPGTYTLTETSVGDLYVKTTETFTLVVNADGEYKITGADDRVIKDTTVAPTVENYIENQRKKGEIVVTKTDDETGLPIAGVTFTLADKSNDNIDKDITATQADKSTVSAGENKKSITGVTDVDGKITFAKLPVEVDNYTITETVPAGYKDPNPLTEEITFKSNPTTVPSVSLTSDWSNTPKTFEITFNKVDEADAPVKDAEFLLTRIDPTTGDPLIKPLTANDHITHEGVSDVNGEVKFTTDVSPGTYTLKETKVDITIYELDHEFYRLVVDTNGNYEIKHANGDPLETANTIVNLFRRGSITITKKDTETGLTMAGVRFTITDASGVPVDSNAYVTTDGVPTTGTTGVTGADGKITFGGLPIEVEEYVITETVPQGYTAVPSSESFEFDNPVNPTHTFDWKNTPVLREISFTKVNEYGRTIDNAVFELTKLDPATGVPLIKPETVNENFIYPSTNVDGVVTFTGVSLGTYKLTEKSVDEDYYVKDTDTFTVVVAAGGTFTITDDTGNNRVITEGASKAIKNESKKGKITITKTDEATGEPIEGATFTIKDKDLDVSFTGGTTDANGEIEFADLPLDGTYEIRESVFPDGYELPEGADNPSEVTFTDSGNLIDDENITWENSRKKVDVSFIKINNYLGGQLVEGAEFKIEADDTAEPIGNTYSDSSGVSGADGVVKFEGVPFGTYTLSETNVPVGYEDNTATEYTLEVRKDGSYAITDVTAEPDVVIKDTKTGAGTGKLVNVVEADYKGSLTIMKLDDGTSEPLAGAVFELTDNFGNKYQSSPSDSNGKVVFTDLPALEDYTVKEITPPSGYDLSTRTESISFTKNASNIYETDDLEWHNTKTKKSTPPPLLPPGGGGGGGGGGDGGDGGGTTTYNPYPKYPTLQPTRTHSPDEGGTPPPIYPFGSPDGNPNQPTVIPEPQTDDPGEPPTDSQNNPPTDGPIDPLTGEPIQPQSVGSQTIKHRAEGEIPSVDTPYYERLTEAEIPQGYIQIERYDPETGDIYYYLERESPFAALNAGLYRELFGNNRLPQTGQNNILIWLLTAAGICLTALGYRSYRRSKEKQA